jgi:hypothetical protein
METMAMEQEGAKNPWTAKNLGRMAVGAVLGAGVGFGFMTMATKMHVSPKGMGWADFLAFWLGVTFLGVGVAIHAISFNRRELAANLECEAELPATNEEVGTFRLQAATLMLAGVMFLLPILGMGTLGRSPRMLFAVIVALFGLQSWANVLLWRRSDEFLRGQMLLTGGITFAIGQGALFLWAVAERLHLVRAASSWETITVLMTLYLSTSAYLSLRLRR